MTLTGWEREREAEEMEEEDDDDNNDIIDSCIRQQ